MQSKRFFPLLLLGVALNSYGLGLLESYAMAAHKDPKLKTAQLNLEATRFELDKAKAGYLPKVQMALSRGRGSTDADTGSAFSSGNRSYDTKNYGITLKQPLLNLTLAPDKQKAIENIDISQLQVQAESLSLFSRVSEKYFNVLHASDVLHTNQQKCNSLERQRIQADKRFRAGVAVKNDMSDLDAEIALANAQILEAEQQLSVARKQFELLTGVAAEHLMGLDYDKLKQSALDQRSLADWIDAARAKNPDLQQAEKEVNVYTYEYQKDRAMHYPTLDLLLSRTKTESDNNITIGSKFDTLSGMLQLNLPIYTGGYASALAAQSAVQIDAAKATQDAKQQELMEKMTSEFANLTNARHLMAAYDKAIGFYEVSLSGAIKAHTAGTRTLGDVLKMRDRLTDTRLSLSKTCYQYLMSYIHLRELSGEIDQTDFASLDEMLKTEVFAMQQQGVAEWMEIAD